MRSSSVRLVFLALVSIPLAAATARAAENVDVGAAPADVAVDPIANRAWVANAVDDTVTVIDGATLETVSVPVGDDPREIAVDAVRGRIWVAEYGGSATVIDATDLGADPVSLPGLNPKRIAIDAATGAAYVLDEAGGGGATLVRIAPDDLATVSEALTGTGPESLAVDWLRGRVWTALGSEIAIADAETLVHTPVTLPGSPTDYAFRSIALDPVANQTCLSNLQPAGIVRILDTTFDQTLGAGDGVAILDPIALRTWVTDVASSSVTAIESDLGTDTIALEAVPGAAAVNPNTGQIYIAAPATDELLVPAGDQLVRRDVGDEPSSIAVNPVTNRIYVANRASNDVSVLDVGVLASETIPAPSGPNAVAVDPIRDVTFVTNSASDGVDVIDAAGAAAPVTVGDQPIAVAVDPASGDAWVANAGSDDVTRIDGATLATDTLPVGDHPVAIAVNPVTSAIYVASSDDDLLTVIVPTQSGTESDTVAVGDRPIAVAVDPAANRIFVANEGGDSVTIVNGETLATQTVPVGDSPAAIVVDPTTGIAYAANVGGSSVTAIDGASGSTEPIATGAGPRALAIDPVLGRLYVANSLADTVTVVDTADGSTENVVVGPGPIALALEAAANRLFVVRSGGFSVMDGVTFVTRAFEASLEPCPGLPLVPAVNPVTRAVHLPGCLDDAVAKIRESRAEIPLEVAISGLVDSTTDTPTPTLDFEATSSFAPSAPPIAQIYYQVDSWMGPWIAATPAGASASATLAPLTPGAHVVYAFAVDGHEAASSASQGSVSLVGAIASQALLVVPAPEPAASMLGAVAIAALAWRRRRA